MLDRRRLPINQAHMQKQPGVQVTALIVIACLFGGGGVAYGLANLVVQLAALFLLALNGNAVWQLLRQSPGLLAVPLFASLALPLLQLVPLPPSAWTELPGREQLVEALAAVSQQGWRPATVSTARTFVAFLGLIAPFTVIALGLAAPKPALDVATQAFIAIGIASILVGAAQVLGGNGTAMLYPETTAPGVMTGFFANRNSTALFMVCCLLLLCGRSAGKPLSARWIASFSAALLLTVGVVLTQSRTGLVLLALPLGLALFKTVAGWTDRRRGAAGGNAGRRMLVAGLAVATVLVGTAAVSAALPHSRLDTVLARFDKSGEQRPAIWEDARFSAQRFWPVGAGMGTFDEVFQVDESLENITPRRAGRAHNDYLEIAIEAGAAGFVVIGLWALWILWATWSAVGSTVGPAQRWRALSGTGILLAVALQSLLDYPLRNQTMLCLAAFAVVLLASARRADAEEPVPSGNGGKNREQTA